MLIDYNKVAEAAASRISTLQTIEEALAAAPAILEHAYTIRDYLERMQRHWKALDAEGRALLPRQLQIALGAVNPPSADHLIQTKTGTTDGQPATQTGLTILAKYAPIPY